MVSPDAGGTIGPPDANAEAVLDASELVDAPDTGVDIDAAGDCSEEAAEEIPTGPDVWINEDDSVYTMSNDIVTVTISKQSGNMKSLVYNGMETIVGGYWSHDTTGGANIITRIAIDPTSNGGDRGEVSVKGISGGIKMGHGPGAEADGDIPADIEIRYSMGRGESGVYTYSIFDHLPEYAAATMTEARFAAGLVDMYDWISVDEQRNRYYPEPVADEDKYAFTAIQSENLAYGWSSTTQKVGWWIINPTIEYLSGGPTKPEFLCHRNTDAAAAPVVLNYWRSSHYGGAGVSVSAGEHWTKVIGPFYMYMNGGDDANAMWDDAKTQAVKEKRKWPYSWVSGVDYPTRNERSAVSGKIVLNDSLMPGGARFIGKLMVGLAYAPYRAESSLGGTREFNWQLDAKHYQFWERVDDQSGSFTIPDVRPGIYTLYAFADGVLGEFTKADITIQTGGAPLDLGQLEWKPIRHGRQLWEIGIANRTATEFMNGDKYFEPDVPLAYPPLFPNDVNFTVDQSDYSRDWYFEHIPHDVNGTAVAAPYQGVVGQGRATPFAIHFNLASSPNGRATLRLAICGTGTNRIDVAVNNTSIGPVSLGIPDGVITGHQVQGLWDERELSVDAALLSQGSNGLTLIVPAGSINNGVIYDYLRLELEDTPTM